MLVDCIMQSGKQRDLILLDFSKAFDKVAIENSFINCISTEVKHFLELKTFGFSMRRIFERYILR